MKTKEPADAKIPRWRAEALRRIEEKYSGEEE